MFEPWWYSNIVHAGDRGDALIQADCCLQFVSHPRCPPDAPNIANDAEWRFASFRPTASQPQQASSTAHSKHKHEQAAVRGNHRNRKLAAIAATRIELVKVVISCDAQFAPRPPVATIGAVDAVGISFVAHITTPEARAPFARVLAPPLPRRGAGSWSGVAVGASGAILGATCRGLSGRTRLAGVGVDPAAPVVVPPRGCDTSKAACQPALDGGHGRGQRSRQTPDVLLMLPSSQKWPRRHSPEHSESACPILAPYLPALHGCARSEPWEHQCPSKAARVGETPSLAGNGDRSTSWAIMAAGAASRLNRRRTTQATCGTAR
eukprot:1231391-Prymnesium_polylepis.1